MYWGGFPISELNIGTLVKLVKFLLEPILSQGPQGS